MRLYDSPVSGNCYKVRLLLSHLGRSYERIEVDVVSRDNRKQLLGSKNPAAKIPVLELDDGTCLAESNAILWYLAEGTPYLPEGALERARVLQWMFLEQNSLEPGIGVARYLVSILRDPEGHAARLELARQAGVAALDALEQHLASEPFLAGGDYSVADIALYAYTHVAPEAGVDLTPFRSVLGWIARVAEQPGHVTIDA